MTLVVIRFTDGPHRTIDEEVCTECSRWARSLFEVVHLPVLIHPRQ